MGEHRAAVRYDWRTRFGKGVDESVPSEIGWSEAIDLVTVLAADPSSYLAASLAGWKHPITREAMTLADLFDVQLGSKSKKKPPPYPRPWATEGRATERKGDAAGRTKAQVRDILNAHGHNLPV